MNQTSPSTQYSELKRLRKLDDSQLEILAKRRAKSIRIAVVLAVTAIAEIARRKIYLERSYSSLAKYIESELGISHSSAYRYSSAAWLVLKLPETLEKLESGALNLESAAEVWRSIRAVEKKPPKPIVSKVQTELKGVSDSVKSSSAAPGPKSLTQTERRAVVARIENQPRDRMKEELREFRAERLGEEPARERPVGGVKRERGWNELRVYVSDDELDLLERLRSLRSHAGAADWNRMVLLAANDSLNQHDPVRKAERKRKREEARVAREPKARGTEAREPKARERKARGTETPGRPEVQQCTTGIPRLDSKSSHGILTSDSRPKTTDDTLPVPRGTPATTSETKEAAEPRETTTSSGRNKRKRASTERKAELHQAQGCCQYYDPATGRVCGSTHFLDFDHVIPLSEGGTNDPGNFRILCAAHNRNRDSLERKGTKGSRDLNESRS